jgi:hypothetical protein
MYSGSYARPPPELELEELLEEELEEVRPPATVTRLALLTTETNAPRPASPHRSQTLILAALVLNVKILEGGC